jgi:hypothetical protein
VGNAGCPLHPQPRVRFVLVESTRVNEYTGITRRSRTQWFYDLLRALPGDRACLTPSSADMACLKPGRARHASANLTPTTEASGPHDFAVRSNIVRQRALVRPALHHVSRLTLPRPPHPIPRFVTIAIRPCCGTGWRELVEMICPTGEAKYFCKRD